MWAQNYITAESLRENADENVCAGLVVYCCDSVRCNFVCSSVDEMQRGYFSAVLCNGGPHTLATSLHNLALLFVLSDGSEICLTKLSSKLCIINNQFMQRDISIYPYLKHIRIFAWTISSLLWVKNDADKLHVKDIFSVCRMVKPPDTSSQNSSARSSTPLSRPPTPLESSQSSVPVARGRDGEFVYSSDLEESMPTVDRFLTLWCAKI